jgi:hypothetical protein
MLEIPGEGGPCHVRIGRWVNVRHRLKHVVLQRHEDLWQPA